MMEGTKKEKVQKQWREIFMEGHRSTGKNLF
jgi:hypothetical protein